MKESVDVVTEIKHLLRRTSKVLSDFDLSGCCDLGFRSVWLYYGNMASAAKAIKIPIAAYRTAIRGQCQISRKASLAIYELPYDAYETVIHGSYMMIEMSEAERVNLFPKKCPLPLTKDAYIKSVETWRKIQVEKWGARPDKRGGFPVEAAYMLLKAYVIGHQIAFKSRGVNYEEWLVQRRGCGFFDGGLSRPFKRAIEFRDRMEDAASVSELYGVALDIIHDYETFCSERSAQKAAINKRSKAQRRIIDSKREEFLIALEKRDGLFCKACESVEHLQIDHIKPVVDGGLSELENLQLLCRICNGIKSSSTMDYLYSHINKSRKPVIK